MASLKHGVSHFLLRVSCEQAPVWARAAHVLPDPDTCPEGLHSQACPARCAEVAAVSCTAAWREEDRAQGRISGRGRLHLLRPTLGGVEFSVTGVCGFIPRRLCFAEIEGANSRGQQFLKVLV